ncbi:helix-turn-helix domain-containing protein [Pedobacter sp.]|uniref:helix-turn-helix domain-containing protein n=1 Tax=Pedobacter sp. TaxID=1411316 RepID=UPI003BAB2756
MSAKIVSDLHYVPANASNRITTLFLIFLEEQFSSAEQRKEYKLRSASGFANQLNIHVNHLNRAVKDVTGKTTSDLISNRFIKEAKKLLTKTTLNISEISYALGFTETSNFNGFFKKHVKISPSKYRKLNTFYSWKSGFGAVNFETPTVK